MTEQKTSAPDWRVGDRIVFDTIVGRYHSTCEINGDLYTHPSSNDDVRSVSVNKNYENIDATIRKKDAEIEALKVQLERSNKIDEANHAFTMSLEQQLYNDPWCYDLDKAPSNQVVLVCFDLSPLLTPVYSLQTVIIRNGNLIDSYTGNSLSELRFIAWILIPEPKGETV